MEERYRNNKDETLHVFDSKGNFIKSVDGKGAEVRLKGVAIPINSIITHNHPRSIGSKGIMRIGNSFSKADIVSAIYFDVAEIRAKTPTYTFSLKRPKEGWGVTVKQVKSAFTRTYKKVYRANVDYLQKRGYNETNNQRASVTTFHDVVKELAKKYGWNYSKKKG